MREAALDGFEDCERILKVICHVKMTEARYIFSSCRNEGWVHKRKEVPNSSDFLLSKGGLPFRPGVTTGIIPINGMLCKNVIDVGITGYMNMLPTTIFEFEITGHGKTIPTLSKGTNRIL